MSTSKEDRCHCGRTVQIGAYCECVPSDEIEAHIRRMATARTHGFAGSEIVHRCIPGPLERDPSEVV